MAIHDKRQTSTRGAKIRKTFERQREQFDTSTIFTPEFQAAIDIALNEGGAIRLGLTRDGGALAVGIYGLGSEPTTEYIRPTDDIGEFWRELYAGFKGSTDL